MTPAEENALVSMARPLGATNASRDAIRLAIRAAVAHERERCAKRIEPKNPKHDWTPYAYQCAELAAAIRRGD